MNAPDVIRLKYAFRNEIRVYTIKSDMTFEALVDQLKASTVQMMDGDVPLGRLQIKYAEDDLVTILDQRDWQECLIFYKEELFPKGQKLKLFLDYEEHKTCFDDHLPKTWSPCSLGLHTPPGTALISNQDRNVVQKQFRDDESNRGNASPPHVITRPRSRLLQSTHGSGTHAQTPARVQNTVSKPEPAPPVDSIKSWVKGNLIGRGANSEVFFGMCKHTAKFFAVKQTLVDKRDPNHTVKIKSLQKEIELMSIHYHENIVRYLGSESRGTIFNIFLEYVPGGSIASLLNRFGSFHEKVVRLYTNQILKGLHFLHSNSVLHRDIKGGNILVSDKGQVKLADFGCSKKITLDSTGTKTLRGTALWMAPEVIRSSTYGNASDIWSVGCTVLEMVSGRPPWTTDMKFDSELQVMYYIANNGGHPKLPTHLTSTAKQFLMGTFNQEPGQRLSTEQLLTHDFIVKECDLEPAGRSMNSGYCSVATTSLRASFSGSLSSRRDKIPTDTLDGGFDSSFATITEDGIEPPKTLSIRKGEVLPHTLLAKSPLHDPPNMDSFRDELADTAPRSVPSVSEMNSSFGPDAKVHASLTSPSQDSQTTEPQASEPQESVAPPAQYHTQKAPAKDNASDDDEHDSDSSLDDLAEDTEVGRLHAQIKAAILDTSVCTPSPKRERALEDSPSPKLTPESATTSYADQEETIRAFKTSGDSFNTSNSINLSAMQVEVATVCTETSPLYLEPTDVDSALNNSEKLIEAHISLSSVVSEEKEKEKEKDKDKDNDEKPLDSPRTPSPPPASTVRTQRTPPSRPAAKGESRKSASSDAAKRPLISRTDRGNSHRVRGSVPLIPGAKDKDTPSTTASVRRQKVGGGGGPAPAQAFHSRPRRANTQKDMEYAEILVDQNLLVSFGNSV